MIDLTPLDVRNKRGDFRKGMRGYEPQEVDHFLELVAERLEGVVRENLSLRDQVEALSTRLERAEGREQAVQEALVSAQSMGDEIRARAERDAELRLREAEQEAREILAAARSQAEEAERGAQQLLGKTRRDLDDLARSRARFLRNYRSLLERELDLVASEEERDTEPQVDLDALRIFSRSHAPPGAGSTNPPPGAGSTNPPPGAGSTNPPPGAGATNPPSGANREGKALATPEEEAFEEETVDADAVRDIRLPALGDPAAADGREGEEGAGAGSEGPDPEAPEPEERGPRSGDDGRVMA